MITTEQMIPELKQLYSFICVEASPEWQKKVRNCFNTLSSRINQKEVMKKFATWVFCDEKYGLMNYADDETMFYFIEKAAWSFARDRVMGLYNTEEAHQKAITEFADAGAIEMINLVEIERTKS